MKPVIGLGKNMYKNFDTLGGDTQGESGRDARLMMRNSTFPLYCTTIL